MAAGSIALTSDNVYGRNDAAREVVFTYTGSATDGTVPDTDLANFTGLTNGPLTGWVLYAFETDPGTTGPTDNSDLYLDSANGTCMIGTDGENIIDNAANNFVFLTKEFFIGPTLTSDVDNQAVHSATWTLKLYMRRDF